MKNSSFDFVTHSDSKKEVKVNPTFHGNHLLRLTTGATHGGGLPPPGQKGRKDHEAARKPI